jgi:hypothetical protein
MKLPAKPQIYWILVANVFLSVGSAFAYEPINKENPCTPIFLACEDKGYVYDKVAEPGQKIWADCADLIINRNQEVRGLQIEPSRLKLCKQYKQSQDRWETEWELHHPVDRQ